MSYSNGLVRVTGANDGVSVRDVQRALGVGSGDVGTLCKHANVNKWAKYKPIKLAQVKPVIESGRQDRNYGIINIPTWTYLSRMATFLFGNRGSVATNTYPSCGYSSSIVYWDYEKPTGGASSPYRLTDFSEYPVSSSPKGYYHMAEAPIGNMETTTINISPEGILQIRFPLGVENVNTLKFSDLTLPDMGSRSLSAMYYGILMKQKSGGVSGNTYAVTQTGTIGQLSASYIVTEIQLTENETTWAGTWQIMPIISSVSISRTQSLDTYNGNYFVATLPYHLQDITISIQKAKAEIISVNAFRAANPSNNHNTAYFQLTLRNEESVSRRYKVIVTLCNSSGETISTFTNNPRTFSGSDYSIPANSSSYQKTVSIDISSMTTNMQSNLYFKVKTEIDLSYQPNIKFREESNWALTGPIAEGSITPSVT